MEQNYQSLSPIASAIGSKPSKASDDRNWKGRSNNMFQRYLEKSGTDQKVFRRVRKSPPMVSIFAAILLISNLITPNLAMAHQLEVVSKPHQSTGGGAAPLAETKRKKESDATSLAQSIMTATNELEQLENSLILAQIRGQEGEDAVIKGQKQRINDIRKSLQDLTQKTRDEFKATRKIFKQQLILDRHDQAVDLFENDMGHFMSDLGKLLGNRTNQETLATVQDLLTFIKNKQKRKGHQFSDPNNLPRKSGPSRVRQPAMTDDELNRLILGGEQNKQSELQKSAPGSEYLAETSESSFSENITALALSLNHDPVAIYNWVRNNIEFVPGYGSIQGAHKTLMARKGNAFDTASLLISLLRTSGVHARYAYGTVDVPVEKVMNWVGGVTVPSAGQQVLGQAEIPNVAIHRNQVLTDIRMEHIWVEAWLDYVPSRGSKHETGDSWIPMDASLKSYEYKQPSLDVSSLDFPQLVQVLNAEISVVGGEVVTINQMAESQRQIESKLGALKNLLDSQNELRVSDVFGSIKIIQDQVTTFSASLPFKISGPTTRFVTLPNRLKHKFTFQVLDVYGETLYQYTTLTEAMENNFLSVQYKPATNDDAQAIQDYVSQQGITNGLELPAYLIRTKMVLKSGDKTLGVGPTSTLGDEFQVTKGYWSPGEGWNTQDSIMTTGEHQTFYLALQGGSLEADSQRIQNSLADLQTHAANGDVAAISDQHIGAILEGVIALYFGLDNYLSMVMAHGSGVVTFVKPSFGSIGLDSTVTYVWGIKRWFGYSGMFLDIESLYSIVASRDDDPQKARQFMHSSGVTSSFLEGEVFNLLFGGDATAQPLRTFSAAKALYLALEEGQKIFVIDQQNAGQILPKLRVNGDIYTEIQAAISSGKTVTIHERSIQQEDWSGTGYVITDPDTGAGAWKISGGLNGGSAGGAGFLTAVIIIGLALVLIGAAIAASPAALIMGSLASILPGFMFLMGVFMVAGGLLTAQSVGFDIPWLTLGEHLLSIISFIVGLVPPLSMPGLVVAFFSAIYSIVKFWLESSKPNPKREKLIPIKI